MVIKFKLNKSYILSDKIIQISEYQMIMSSKNIKHRFKIFYFDPILKSA